MATIAAGRIPTTHVGSLPRPPALLERMHAHAKGWRIEEDERGALHDLLAESVAVIVARQVEIGVDLVSDGELSKPSYATYVTERLTGFGGEWKGGTAAD